jgi:hypothetical protein
MTGLISDVIPGMDDFLAISVGLTGFDARELNATGMAERYHTVVTQQVDAAFYDAFVKSLLEARSDPLAVAEPHVLEVARALTHLWYLGVWPGLPQPTSTAIGGADAADAPFVVSARAYAQGLAWKAFGGTPPGTAAPGFGSWGRPPQRIRATETTATATASAARLQAGAG